MPGIKPSPNSEALGVQHVVDRVSILVEETQSGASWLTGKSKIVTVGMCWKIDRKLLKCP